MPDGHVLMMSCRRAGLLMYGHHLDHGERRRSHPERERSQQLWPRLVLR